jgi:hypothetical protein
MDGGHVMEARMNQLKPTVFVDAVPELAAERTRRREKERRREAEECLREPWELRRGRSSRRK